MAKFWTLQTGDMTPGGHSLSKGLLNPGLATVGAQLLSKGPFDPGLATFGAQLRAAYQQLLQPAAALGDGLSQCLTSLTLPPLKGVLVPFTLPPVRDLFPDLQVGLAPFPDQHLSAPLVLPPMQNLFPSEWDLCELALMAIGEGDVTTFDRFITQILGFPATRLNGARRVAFWKVLRERRWQRAQQPFHYLTKAQRVVYQADKRAAQAADDAWLMHAMFSPDELPLSQHPMGSLLPNFSTPLSAFEATYNVQQACQRLDLSVDAILMAEAQLLYDMPRRDFEGIYGWDARRIDRAYKEFFRNRTAIIALLKKIS